MRLTPAQIGVRLICGEHLPFVSGEESFEQRIQHGRATLIQISGTDFGYDLQAWHDHLKQSRQGGYTYARTIKLPLIMKAALQSSEWQRAVERLTAARR